MCSGNVYAQKLYHNARKRVAVHLNKTKKGLIHNREINVDFHEEKRNTRVNTTVSSQVMFQ